MTEYNLKNPIAPIITNPIGLDFAIQELQLLFASLSWLTKSFSRAREVNKIPMVYQGTKEYYPAMPNDALQAYSFFRVAYDRRALNYSVGDSLLFFESPVDIIFWCNLKQIDINKDYVFTDELIHDVLKLISLNTNTRVIRVWDDRPEDVFKNYQLEAGHRDLLMYPYTAFRIETLLSYNYNCVENQILPPSTQAYNIIFNNVTDSSFEVSWTRGNGEYCLVVLTYLNNDVITPIDNITYQYDSVEFTQTIGNTETFIVYKGIGTSLFINNGIDSSLNPFKITVFEFNGGEGQEKYLISLTGNGEVNLL